MNISAVLNLWSSGMDTADIASLLGVPEFAVWNKFSQLDRAGFGRHGGPRVDPDLRRIHSSPLSVAGLEMTTDAERISVKVETKNVNEHG